MYRFLGMAFGLMLLAACLPAQPPRGGLGGAPQGGGIDLPESRTGWATFTNRAVNVRAQPTSGSAKLGTLAKNTVVDVYGTNSGWTLVRLETGGRGWVFSKYLGRRAVAAKPRVKRKPRPTPDRRTPVATPDVTPTPTPDVVVGVCEGANCGGDAVEGGAVPGE